MAKYRTGLEHDMQLHVILHVMTNSSDQEIPDRDPGNLEQRRWSLHPLLGALLILGGRELSIWLLAGPAIDIGSAYVFAYGLFGAVGAVAVLVVLLGAFALAIFGINRAVKWMTGSGLYFF